MSGTKWGNPGPEMTAGDDARDLDGDRHALDQRLMERVADGDAEAFARLYDLHCDRVYSIARWICRERAEDAAQEAFLDVWRSRERFDPARGRVDAWTNRLARNRAIDALRIDMREAGRRAEGGGIERLAAEPVDPKLERSEMWGSLKRLSAPQRQAILLCYFAGLTREEAARSLGVPLGTLKGRIRLALERLRQHGVGEAGEVG